jgi:branched-chain amino acid transport system substrate-binding protein
MSDRIKIVSGLTRSGSSKGQSDSVVNAIRMRLEDANYEVAGATIIHEDLDDGSPTDPSWVRERVVANARNAAADPLVAAYIGTLDADAAPHAIPILNAAGPLLMISPTNTYAGLTRPVPFAPDEPSCYYPTGVRNYCRTVMTDDLQGRFAADWAAELGVGNVFILDDGQPYGRAVADAFRIGCRSQGIHVVEVATIERRARTFADLARRVDRSKVDAVYYGGLIQSGAGRLWRDLRATIPDITLLAADALFEEAFLIDAGAHAVGTFVTFGGVPPAHLQGRGREFYLRYRERWGREPEPYAAASYDACSVILDAIQRAGTTDRAAITRAALDTRDFDGVLGTWSFDANGDIELPTMSRIGVTEDGWSFLGTAPVPAAS